MPCRHDPEKHGLSPRSTLKIDTLSWFWCWAFCGLMYKYVAMRLLMSIVHYYLFLCWRGWQYAWNSKAIVCSLKIYFRYRRLAFLCTTRYQCIDGLWLNWDPYLQKQGTLCKTKGSMKITILWQWIINEITHIKLAAFHVPKQIRTRYLGPTFKLFYQNQEKESSFSLIKLDDCLP